jgi:putative nucleotidyltransferase with HDIG domain
VDASTDPATCINDIGALVESDIATSAKVLQLVNSSFFGLGRRISSAREAVVYLGIAPLRALVLSAGAFRAFAPTRPIDDFSVDALELHSTCVARLASALLPGKREAEDAFTAGMLHDVGKLILAAHRPDELAALLAAAGTSGRPLHAIERERTGVTHAEIGAYLLTLWGLPHPIVEAVVHHHAPTRLETTKLDPAAAVCIANLLVNEQQHDSGETPDDEFLASLGAADQLATWTTLAAKHVHTATGEH